MKTETQSNYIKRLETVLSHIQNNLDQEISLNELAHRASFSKYHFHRIFKGVVGEGVATYIRRLKMERAAQNICYGRCDVTDAAFDCGYSTVEAFIKSFKKMFGVPPLKYKQCSKALTLKKGVLDLKVEIKKMEARKILTVRHTGPYDQCGPAWEKLCSFAGRNGLLGADTQFMGLSYDDPDITPPEKIRYDAAVTINNDIEIPDGFSIQEIEAGEFAVTTHKGSFKDLHKTYVEFCGHWGSQSGREFKSGASIELHLNDPEKTPPEELLVEIQLPLL